MLNAYKIANFHDHFITYLIKPRVMSHEDLKENCTVGFSCIFGFCGTPVH